jgi:hypothetical protein
VGASSLAADPAFAVSPPQVTVQAGATKVEVGEPFSIELQALVEQGDPQPMGAELAPPRDFNVVTKREGPQMLMDGRGLRVGLRAVWQLVGQKPGKYTIPSPTVQWNGRRLSGSAVTIEVVPATGRATRPQPQNSPFLVPSMQGFGFSFSLPSFPRDEDVPSKPKIVPELALPTAPDPAVFLHASADKKSVVVGEQVAVSILVYGRDQYLRSRGNHDAPLADFLRLQLNPNPGTTENMGHATAGGTEYSVARTDWLAIFPTKAGDLHTGQWRYDFITGRRQTLAERASEDLVIHVTEPPRAGRPVGYTLGDVGQFSLSAEVAPRRIEQGGEIAVTARLSGTGNLPQSLHLPERTGIEWLEPEKKEAIEPQGGVVGGWRTFGYVVRIKESGSIDLGEVTLPYWDPAAKKYQVAKAALGKVEVDLKLGPRDPATQDAQEQQPPDPFVAMPAARATLGAYTPPRPRLLEGRPMWIAIVAPPLLVGASYLGAGAARRARTRRETAKGSPAALARKALAEAQEAQAAGDVRAVAAALERAIHLAIEGGTGLKSRGVLVSDLPAELAERGLSPELGDAISSALSACEAVRFDPQPGDAAARDLATQVRAVVADLERHGREGASSPAPAGAP